MANRKIIALFIFLFFSPSVTLALPPDLDFKPDSGVRVDQASNPIAKMTKDGAVQLMWNAHGSDGRTTPMNSVSTVGLDFTANARPVAGAAVGPTIRLKDGTWRKFIMRPNTSHMTSESSQDGVKYVPEHGVRYFAHASDKGSTGIFDFYRALNGDVVMLYLGDLHGLNNLRRAVSRDDGWTFVFERGDVLGDAAAGGGSNSYVDHKIIRLSDGRLRLFAMRRGQAIYSFLSLDDGKTFVLEPGTRLKREDFSEFNVLSLHDPSVVRFPDGRYRMYVCARISDGAGSKEVILSATTAAMPVFVDAYDDPSQ